MQTTDHTRLMSDEELIHRIISGETPLYEILIRRHNPVLYKIARSSGLNHQDAEDMMQEAHMSAFLELKNFGGRSSYKTWLSKIMLHKCYHKLHYGSLKFELQQDELQTVKDIAIPGFSKNTTERTVINKELGLLLEQSLQQLRLHYRQIFVLREIEQFSVLETAEMLSLTPTNVKVRLNRAKALLQKQLEQYYSTAEIYEFNLVYCDAIVSRIFKKISELENK